MPATPTAPPPQTVILLVPQRPMLWAMFFNAAITGIKYPTTIGMPVNDEHLWIIPHAAVVADAMMSEFDKRYPNATYIP